MFQVFNSLIHHLCIVCSAPKVTCPSITICLLYPLPSPLPPFPSGHHHAGRKGHGWRYPGWYRRTPLMKSSDLSPGLQLQAPHEAMPWIFLHPHPWTPGPGSSLVYFLASLIKTPDSFMRKGEWEEMLRPSPATCLRRTFKLRCILLQAGTGLVLSWTEKSASPGRGLGPCEWRFCCSVSEKSWLLPCLDVISVLSIFLHCLGTRNSLLILIMSFSLRNIHCIWFSPLCLLFTLCMKLLDLLV